METPENQVQNVEEDAKKALNERMERIGWALFLIMIGGLGLVGRERVPEGVWSIGVGLIFLGLNAARYLNGIKMSGFTMVLGVVALLSGIGDLLGVDLPILAIVLILLGANLLLRPLFERDKGEMN